MNPGSILRYIAGAGIDWAKDSLNFPVRVATAHGGIGAFRLFHRRFIAITDADVAHQVLTDTSSVWVRGRPTQNLKLAMGESVFTTDGDQWQAHHALVSPPFKNAEIVQRFDEIWQVIGSFIQQLAAASSQQPEQSVCDQSKYLTHATIHRVLFERSLTVSDSTRWSHWVDQVLNNVVARNTAVFNLPLWVPTPSNLALKSVRREFKSFINEAVIQSLETKEPSSTQIGVVKQLNARTGCPYSTAHKALTSSFLDEVLTLYVAGFETTSLVLSWALYYIANNPGVQEKLFREIDEHLKGEAPSIESLKSLKYLNCVLNETLRIQPPVHLIPKINTQDTTLGDGVRVPKGTIALVSVYGVHRNPECWEAPEIFDPERFMSRSEKNAKAFLPFALGLHTCLGSHLAMLELRLALVAICQKFKLEAVTKDVQAFARVLLTPDRDMVVRFLPR